MRIACVIRYLCDNFPLVIYLLESFDHRAANLLVRFGTFEVFVEVLVHLLAAEVRELPAKIAIVHCSNVAVEVLELAATEVVVVRMICWPS